MFRIREIWAHRRLVYFLSWRDVKIRYKQTVVGVAWAVVQPFLLMIVFSLFLGRITGQRATDGLPYPVFLYAGLVPWTLFQSSVGQAANSLVSGQSLVTKIYVPRLILPMASVGALLFDFTISLAIVFGLMAYYGIPITLAALWVVPLTLFAVCTALAVGIWFSALNAVYRDIRYATPFLLQAWMFATPVIVSSRVFPETLRPFVGLNPMAGVVEGFRWALLSSGHRPGLTVALSIGVTILVGLTGLVYFHRSEARFVDLI